MLSSHSRLYIPPESDFIPYFFRDNPDEILSDKRIETLLHIIFKRYRFVGEWKGSIPKINEIIIDMPGRKPAEFLNALYSLYASQNGKIRWGDKTPIYASYINTIHRIFPDAKFIHIVRDPFDCAISLLEKYEKEEFHIDIYFAARNWLRRINDINVSSRSLPKDRYFELKYEDLVTHPEQYLHDICDFLGEDFEATMLDPHILAQKKIDPNSRFFANVRKPISSDSIGRGRRELSTVDKCIIQEVCSKLMSVYGYAQDNIGLMSTTEIIRMTLLKLKYELLQAGRRTATNFRLLPPI